jgi:mannose-6-phosphate isomerase-like protein (cupin superfamily)
MRRVVAGTLATGEVVGVHETTQPVGAVSSALHTIQHSEMIVVVAGTVEFHHEDKVDRVGPGGVIYVALGTHHYVKNVGDVPATYVVVAIGGDVKK